MKRYQFVIGAFAVSPVVAVSRGAISDPNVTTVMCLGDSITAGYNGVTNYDTGYRGDLLADLTAQGKQIQYVGTYDPTTYTGAGYDVAGYSPALTALGQNMNVGYSGYTSQLLEQNLNGNVNPSYYTYGSGVLPNMGGYWMTGGNGTGRGTLAPDVILLMAGTNDAYRGEGIGNFSTDGTTLGSIAEMLAYFNAALPSTHVIVTVPPLNTNSQSDANLYAEESQLPSYIAANYPQDSFLDMIPVVPSYDLSGDGTHPTDTGYALMANAFDKAVTPYVAVPEPTTLALVAVGSLATLRRRRHV